MPYNSSHVSVKVVVLLNDHRFLAQLQIILTRHFVSFYFFFFFHLRLAQFDFFYSKIFPCLSYFIIAFVLSLKLLLAIVHLSGKL